MLKRIKQIKNKRLIVADALLVAALVKHIRAVIKAYRSGKITKEKLLMKYASWEGHAKHADTYRLRMKIKGQIEAEIKKKELIGNGSITPDN